MDNDASLSNSDIHKCRCMTHRVPQWYDNKSWVWQNLLNNIAHMYLLSS
jgi:hypothetical protein